MESEKRVAGQRWISEAEPELGLGLIMKEEFGRIEIYFPAAGLQRVYALQSAPIRRVRFHPGDTITTHEGQSSVVESVLEQDGLLVYKTEKGEVPEAHLSDSISFSKPEDRLLAGKYDDNAAFLLRSKGLEKYAAWRSSELRGFIGTRMDLIPHQLAIAMDVASRLRPRVLLADEVGLGKTIEACLILHRLLLTGRVKRVLIVVPESLVHQWFVELLRRFNLQFSLYDVERYNAIGRADFEANPFHDEQLVLTSMDVLTGSEVRKEAALNGDWDLLIVDEAHHLEWAEDGASEAYQCIEGLAQRTPGVLLLTATPEQLGMAGHFARLRLLDPDRYVDLAAFEKEAEEYKALAQWLDAMEAKGDALIKKSEITGWGSVETNGSWDRYLESWGEETAKTAAVICEEVTEAFGPGRVWLRHTRTALKGFPVREAHLHRLKGTLDQKFALQIKWLLGLIDELGEAKVLVICKTRKLAETIIEGLQQEVNLRAAVFHEGLTLLQRDRNAAYFAEEDGARVLVCSEIGSEGRNFQFSHHLVLWDLPDEPELLEQRIGRLDRIGQREAIRIHVPYIAGTRDEALVRWYHEGLNSFETSVPGAHALGVLFGDALKALRDVPSKKEVDGLIKQVIKKREAMVSQLQTGRDRLLTSRPELCRAAEAMIEAMKAVDDDRETEGFILDLLEAVGVLIDPLDPRVYKLNPSELQAASLPMLQEMGLIGTFDRKNALSREERQFLSAEHPTVDSALESFLGGTEGNVACALWPSDGGEAMYLECIYIAECVTKPEHHMDRFFPPAPVRVIVSHDGTIVLAKDLWEEGELALMNPRLLLEREVVKRKIIPRMLKKTRESAEVVLGKRVTTAEMAIQKQLDAEIHRLSMLKEINGHVQAAEIEAIRGERQALLDALTGARLRLDSIRLVWRRSEG